MHENEYSVVGRPVPRIDGRVKVTGTATFADDMAMVGMLHGKLLRSPYAHARIKNIDTSKAEKMPGVRAVLTGETPGADIPWYERRGQFSSRLFDPNRNGSPGGSHRHGIFGSTFQ